MEQEDVKKTTLFAVIGIGSPVKTDTATMSTSFASHLFFRLSIRQASALPILASKIVVKTIPISARSTLLMLNSSSSSPSFDLVTRYAPPPPPLYRQID